MSTDASAPKREPVDVQRLRDEWFATNRPGEFCYLAHKRDLAACLDEIEKLRAMLRAFIDLDDGDEQFAWKHEELFNRARAAMRGEPKEGM